MDQYPAHMIDFYKSGHIYQYPEKTEMVFSNLTARASRDDEVDEIVFFGLQYLVKKYLQYEWDVNFFDAPIEDVLDSYSRRMNNALGKDSVKTDHIKALHDLGYLPIEIRAVEEGERVDIKVPCMTIHNTLPEFFWLTNYLETILSCVIWPMITSATKAYQYKKILSFYAAQTGGDKEFVKFQGHDFSFRGMFGPEAAMMSGAAHLTSFVGTDTVPAIDFLEEYYGANSDNELVGCSIPATEHSVMSLGGQDDEIGTFRNLITKVYPNGNVGVVSDTWDFWKVITEYLPILKDEIMARDGTVVIRPDSGIPEDIICGKPFPYIDDNHGGDWDAYAENMKADGLSPQIERAVYKGAVECLWETFGGTTTERGFKVLDKHIGLIYGDSITVDRCREICQRLEAKSFASTNVVFGIGSYTYQYTTRDQYGFAVKATYAEVAGRSKNIFKKPKTDDGTKNSAKGLTAVFKEPDGNYRLEDEVKWYAFDNCDLGVVFRDGRLLRETTLEDIREKLQ
jgi:nicotinamide phosphoribosyltransferase